MLRIILLQILLIISMPSFAESAKNDAAARSMLDGVMEKVSAENYVEALQALGRYTPAGNPSQSQAIGMQIKANRDKIREYFGKSAGYELVREEKPSQYLWRLYYLERGTVGATPWVFTLYKSREGWVVNSFSIKDNLDVFFSSAQ